MLELQGTVVVECFYFFLAAAITDSVRPEVDFNEAIGARGVCIPHEDVIDSVGRDLHGFGIPKNARVIRLAFGIDAVTQRNQ